MDAENDKVSEKVKNNGHRLAIDVLRALGPDYAKYREDLEAAGIIVTEIPAAKTRYQDELEDIGPDRPEVVWAGNDIQIGYWRGPFYCNTKVINDLPSQSPIVVADSVYDWRPLVTIHVRPPQGPAEAETPPRRSGPTLRYRLDTEIEWPEKPSETEPSPNPLDLLSQEVGDPAYLMQIIHVLRYLAEHENSTIAIMSTLWMHLADTGRLVESGGHIDGNQFFADFKPNDIEQLHDLLVDKLPEYKEESRLFIQWIQMRKRFADR